MPSKDWKLWKYVKMICKGNVLFLRLDIIYIDSGLFKSFWKTSRHSTHLHAGDSLGRAWKTLMWSSFLIWIWAWQCSGWVPPWIVVRESKPLYWDEIFRWECQNGRVHKGWCPVSFLKAIFLDKKMVGRWWQMSSWWFGKVFRSVDPTSPNIRSIKNDHSSLP